MWVFRIVHSQLVQPLDNLKKLNPKDYHNLDRSGIIIIVIKCGNWIVFALVKSHKKSRRKSFICKTRTLETEEVCAVFEMWVRVFFCCSSHVQSNDKDVNEKELERQFPNVKPQLKFHQFDTVQKIIQLLDYNVYGDWRNFFSEQTWKQNFLPAEAINVRFSCTDEVFFWRFSIDLPLSKMQWQNNKIAGTPLG